MKTPLFTIIFLFFCTITIASHSIAGQEILGEGSQPQVSIDSRNTIRVVYGQHDKIFCVESHDGGINFSKPILVAEVAGMHLGMSRGPQLACSNQYSVITAMDKSGNIHWYRLSNSSGKWENMGLLNDQPGSAPEGLMNIAADRNDHFYAVWLDIRTGKHNQIYFADLAPKAIQWSKNRLVYKSPDEHVCECCQPHIAVNNAAVAIMFRNWLNGSRDLYLITSKNRGTSFSQAQKLGTSTWKLNACPMDGGGLSNNPGPVVTTWQREGNVFYCQPGQPEKELGRGRNGTIAASNSDTFIGYQTGDTVKLASVKTNKTEAVGRGGFMKIAFMPNKKLLCVWEVDNKIVFTLM